MSMAPAHTPQEEMNPFNAKDILSQPDIWEEGGLGDLQDCMQQWGYQENSNLRKTRENSILMRLKDNTIVCFTLSEAHGRQGIIEVLSTNSQPNCSAADKDRIFPYLMQQFPLGTRMREYTQQQKWRTKPMLEERRLEFWKSMREFFGRK